MSCVLVHEQKIGGRRKRLTPFTVSMIRPQGSGDLGRGRENILAALCFREQQIHRQVAMSILVTTEDMVLGGMARD